MSGHGNAPAGKRRDAVVTSSGPGRYRQPLINPAKAVKACGHPLVKAARHAAAPPRTGHLRRSRHPRRDRRRRREPAQAATWVTSNAADAACPAASATGTTRTGAPSPPDTGSSCPRSTTSALTIGSRRCAVAEEEDVD